MSPEVRRSGGPEVAEWRPLASLTTLRQRAELVERTRTFFRERGVLEVDVPVLQGGANLDRGVVPFRVDTPDGPRFLPTSPEHPLKRLVCAGAGAVWTLAPAFRCAEHGRKHRSEFRMLEWYRPDWDDLRLSEEVIELLDLLTGLGPTQERLTWRDSFIRHAGLDPLTASDSALRAALGSAAPAARDRRECLDLLLAELVEPHLGRTCWTILTDYPPEAAALVVLRLPHASKSIATALSWPTAIGNSMMRLNWRSAWIMNAPGVMQRQPLSMMFASRQPCNPVSVTVPVSLSALTVW